MECGDGGDGWDDYEQQRLRECLSEGVEVAE